ncbi:protein kinase [Streptomyces tendae]|uniref:non-specific serine/threonine protein kinase n=1 Tax=Streptomyces tendae TaxID=1932 RepID=A0A6B3QLW3_STRTE|nr:serine/threonine-protein kinase [Streptomyces tendae]NEV89119.1 protein kinase [Streptomyces tendae]
MGEVFAGRYELVDPIGRGGVGAVWRAWDHRRRRYVAAKVLQQRDAHSLLRFVREQALRIDHPHVLAPASWAADDDQVLFTMDLVTGGSLVHLVGDYGPLPPDFVCTLLDQLLSGLAAVHGEGVVHRDIKPANLLLEATGTGRPRLRLSDFGIAMRLGEPRLTETNLVVGTPGYLAPEQMMGAEPDFPADLFAVGLVALYLLEGAKPDAKALVQHFAEHGTPPAPRGMSEPLWQVVATLLQPDPSARFRTATGARKALAAAVELLPEPGPDDELIEIFDQVGPLPPGFGPEGPLKRASGVDDTPTDPRRPPTDAHTDSRHLPADAHTDPRYLPADATPSPHATPATPAWPTAPPPDLSPAGAGAPSTPPTPATGTPTPHGWSPSAPPAPDGAPVGPTGHTPSSGQGWTPPVPAASPSASGPAHPDPGGTPSAEAPGAERDGAMSETGSFHLPPPQPTTTSQSTSTADPAQPPTQQRAFTGAPQQHLPHHLPQPQPQPQNSPPDGTPYRTPHGPPLPAQALAPSPPQRSDVPTAAYTARNPRSAPPAQHRGGRRRRRPGPPARVALPLLLLALACYAVGFWALTRI